MLKLHRIEIQNVRAIGDAVFEPLTDGGFTALNGPNGTGKTTVLIALVWALFGVTPDGVAQTALRRQGTDAPVKVVVTYEVDGQIVTVERGLKGRNDASYVMVAQNGVEQAFGKVRAAEEWIRGTLGGLDSEGFLTAFVIRQKEMDDLVKATPAVRRKTVERLAGIERMSKAVKTAAEEALDVKRRLEHMPGSQAELDAAKQAVNEAQENGVLLWTVFETAQETEETRREAHDVAEAAALVMRDKVTAHQNTERVLFEARHQAAAVMERAAATRRDLDTTRAAAVGGAPNDVAAAHAKFTTVNEAVAVNRDALAAVTAAVATARQAVTYAQETSHRVNELTVTVAHTETVLNETETRLAGFPVDLDDRIETVTRQLAEDTETVGALRGEYTRLSTAIDAMEKAVDSAHCPTCATALPDPTVVVTALRTQRDQAGHDGKALAATITETTTLLTSLRAQATEQHTLTQTVTHHRALLADQTRQTEEANRVASEAAAAAQEAQTVCDTVQQEAAAAAQQTPVLDEALTQAQEELRVAQVAAAAYARLDELTALMVDVDQAAQTAAKEVATAETNEQETRYDVTERDSLYSGFEQARMLLQQATQARLTADADFRVANEQIKAAEKEADTQEQYRKARVEAAHLFEIRTATREALDQFRKNRIASLAPELSEIATDHIVRMTDGKFTAIELDEDFTPVITADTGELRPVAWLSGGEESAVALAVRLAIGEVIAGSHGGGLLWMDEPQTAMDATRRPAMMSVIRDLDGRQPIIISHVTEATDMVDLVLEVVPDPINGSRIKVADQNNTTDDLTVLDHIDDIDDVA